MKLRKNTIGVRVWKYIRDSDPNYGWRKKDTSPKEVLVGHPFQSPEREAFLMIIIIKVTYNAFFIINPIHPL